MINGDYKVQVRDVEFGDSSRYARSKIFYNDVSSFLETYDMKEIPIKDDDTYIQITSAWENRLDLVANEFYRDSDMWWVIATANDIMMPWFLPVGTELRIPGVNTLWGYKGVMLK